MEKFHIIYKITNQLNGRYYIGMHSTSNPNDNYLGSGRRIKAEVKKYGRENFTKEILEHLPDRAALETREAELVNQQLLEDPLCLNLKNGGEGGWKFDPIQQLRAASAGGKVSGPKTVQTMHTAEARAKSLETRRKLGAFGNVVASEAARLPENVAKRKATMAERGHSQGEKNSQFGTCWVTNGAKAIKIKKDLLDEYLANGYSKGRALANLQGNCDNPEVFCQVWTSRHHNRKDALLLINSIMKYGF